MNCQNQIGHNLAKYAKQNCYNPSFFSYSTTYTGKEKGDGFSFYCSSRRIARNWWYLLVKVTSQLSLGSVSTKQHFFRLLVLWLEGSKVSDAKYYKFTQFFFLEECLDITSTDPQNNYCSKVFQELKNLKVHSILYFSTKHLMGKKNTPSDIIYAST